MSDEYIQELEDKLELLVNGLKYIIKENFSISNDEMCRYMNIITMADNSLKYNKKEKENNGAQQ